MSNHEPNVVSHPDQPPANDQVQRPADQSLMAPAALAGASSLEPEAGADASVSGGKPEAEAIEPGPGRPVSERRLTANRLNAQNSTGPRSLPGKLRSSQNARISVRLLGLAEAHTLNQDLNAAGQLYRQLIAPYEPAPPLLARQFEDLARLYLELEAWERIRDAQLEDRWQQTDIECRRSYQEMQRDLQGTAQELLKNGLCRQPESAARFKKQAECLDILKDHLTRRDFNFGLILRYLYGQELNPPSDRALTICARCQKLANPETRPSLTGEEFEELLNVLEEELRDALLAYALCLDEKTMTRVARLARLGPTRDDHWTNRHAERLIP
jgi:hypothetical protein